MNKKEINIKLDPIGIIHSPYNERSEAPRQGRYSNCECEIEIFPEYFPALKYLDNSSHLIVLYWGDRSDRSILQSKTPFSEVPVGVFASRSPNRPNPIAFCIAKVLKIEGTRLTVNGLDALDNSLLLDIKTYAPSIDCVPEATHNPHHEK